MNPDRFRSALKHTPFKPFTVRTTSGESYHVAHPELAWISPAGETLLVMENKDMIVMDTEHVAEVVYPGKKSAKGAK